MTTREKDCDMTDTLRDKIRRLVRDELPATRAADEHAGDVADAIIAALPSILPDMVWNDTDDYGQESGDYPWCECQSIIGDYSVGGHSDGTFWAWFDPINDAIGSDHATIEAAKAAANAHRRAAWMAALIGEPT